mmetsp:Transcript_38609/g.92384  ORF Transcript_38609/g.92384 Transcript_38609/m.92384 type:complete len:230 (-) Transcript_38609:63-752(-)
MRGLMVRGLSRLTVPLIVLCSFSHDARWAASDVAGTGSGPSGPWFPASPSAALLCISRSRRFAGGTYRAGSGGRAGASRTRPLPLGSFPSLLPPSSLLPSFPAGPASPPPARGALSALVAARALGRRSSLPLPPSSSSAPGGFSEAGAFSSPDGSVSESPAPPPVFFSPPFPPPSFPPGGGGPSATSSPSESSVSESPAPGFVGAAGPACRPWPWGWGAGGSLSSSSPS